MTVFTQLIVCLLVGFGVSYSFSWLFHLIQDPQNSAALELPPGVRQFATLALLFAAGAFVLARETVSAQGRGEWPESYLAGGYLLSMVWSVVIGFAVTQIVIG